MRTIFLDTNIAIDFLADRKPFSDSASQLFNLGMSGKIKLYLSAVSYNNIYYIIRQSHTEKETILILKELQEMADIADVTKEVIKNALKSDFKDFEDAILYHCAIKLGLVDFIVTRNSKDFKKSEIPVFLPDEAINIIENES
jgi:predicted nucleic acid-binding protein